MVTMIRLWDGAVHVATSKGYMSNDSALQQMPDISLQGWFKAVAQAAATPPPPVAPHTLTKDAKSYINTLHNFALNMNDQKIIDEAADKGYQVIGVTASLKYYYSLAEKDQYYSTTCS